MFHFYVTAMVKVFDVNVVCEGRNVAYHTLLVGVMIPEKNQTDPLLLQQHRDPRSEVLFTHPLR